MSSKHASAEGTKELFYDLLKLIASLEGDIELVRQLERRKNKKHYRRLFYLQQKGYITHQKNSFALTSLGRAIVSEREIWELEIPKPKTWDKKWRFVLFDIPKDRRKRRDIFRLRLKELGLVLYQDSVWIHPYPLTTPVKAAADFYGLSKCVSFAIAERLTGETWLKRHFGL